MEPGETKKNIPFTIPAPFSFKPTISEWRGASRASFVGQEIPLVPGGPGHSLYELYTGSGGRLWGGRTGWGCRRFPHLSEFSGAEIRVLRTNFAEQEGEGRAKRTPGHLFLLRQTALNGDEGAGVVPGLLVRSSQPSHQKPVTGNTHTKFATCFQTSHARCHITQHTVA